MAVTPETWAAEVFMRQALSDLLSGLDPLAAINAAEAILDGPPGDEADELMALAASYAGDLA